MNPMLASGVLGGAAALLLGLAACGDLDEEVAEMDRQAFERSCDGLGIARDSPSWDQCMLQQQNQLARQQQQNLAALQQQDAIDKQNKQLKKQQKKLDREIEALDDY
jgi:hypothetical protein